MSTRRERIAETLERAGQPLTAQDICEALGIRSRSIVYQDLDHIAKSIKRRGKRLIIQPARCGKCGYLFSGRASLKKPSRCPKCKSEWILQPAYLIRDRG